MCFTLNQHKTDIQSLKNRVEHLEKTIKRIASAAGLPDAGDACRTVLKFCKESGVVK